MSSRLDIDQATWLLHGDRDQAGERTVAPSIPYSATFVAQDAEQFESMATTPRHPRYYTRYGNPLHDRVAALVAGLEGAESGLCLASGMAAISAVTMGLLQSGDHVVAQANHYMGTTLLLTEVLPRMGVSTTLVDQSDTNAFITAIRPDTRLVHLETPANPTLALTDIAAVAEAAHRAGALITVDNTVASPMNQTPIQLGADLVMHSATKALGGHHDITAGIVVGSQAHCARVWRTAVVLGATLSPMDAWLLLRGLRTLAVRTERQNATAQAVAEFLASHREVRVVHYPGLTTHPQHSLAARQMHGFGPLMAAEIRGGYDAAERLVGRLRLFTNAVSLGGVDSLAVHPAAMWSGSLDTAQMKSSAIEPSLVRLSIGLESAGALCDDLDQALNPKESVS
jgi:cystathionine beta-lyase/cystathionine gamma-synthase